MKKYYTLGLNIYFEKDLEKNIFCYTFKQDKLETRLSVSDNVLLMSEEVKYFEYQKALNNRIGYFSRKFK